MILVQEFMKEHNNNNKQLKIHNMQICIQEIHLIQFGKIQKLLKKHGRILQKKQKEELEYVIKAADKGDFQPLWKMAEANKFIIISVVVPLVAIFRFPAAVLVAFRFAAPIVTGVAFQLIRSGHAPAITAYLWRQLIEFAKNRKERKNNKK